jgi:hypothetical protein
MPPHTHASRTATEFGTRLMAMSAGRRMAWAAGIVAVLWLAVWWALSFEAVR